MFASPAYYGSPVEVCDTQFNSVLIWSSNIKGSETYFCHPEFSIGVATITVNTFHQFGWPQKISDSVL